MKATPLKRIENYFAAPPHPQRVQGGRRTRDASGAAETPLISIVTVVYNGAATVERAIRSVLEQDFKNVEYIIIDGASTDGTLDIIRRHDDQIALWISEPDGGIFDAMNKGIAHARGAYIALLNCDDYYLRDAFAPVAKLASEKPDVIFGDYIFAVDDVALQKVIVTSANLLRGMTLGHPATFVSREAYARHGLHDLRYRFAGDFDILLRLFVAGCRFSRIDAPLACFTSSGAAETNLVTASREALLSLYRQCGILATRHYLMMALRRVSLRTLTAITRGLFGKGAYIFLRRKYYLWQGFQPLRTE